MSMLTKVTNVILNIKTSLVFKKCWGASVVLFCSHICKCDFIALAYEGNKLSPSNIEGSHKLLCLVLNTDIRRN